MRDLRPLTDCWVQMWLIKKKIKRKTIKLNRYKLQGRRRLREMRLLRDELLKSLRTLIEVKLMKIQSKRGGRMLHLYRRWLRKSQKNLREQQIKFKEMAKEEKELDRQLRLLRKQLGVMPNRKRVKFLEKVKEVVDNEKVESKQRSRKHKLIMKVELENIIEFLLKQKKIYRHKHKTGSLIDMDFLFDNEELKQREARKSHKQRKISFPVGSKATLKSLHARFQIKKWPRSEKRNAKSQKLIKSGLPVGYIGSLRPFHERYKTKRLPQGSRTKSERIHSIWELYHLKDRLDMMNQKEANYLKKLLHNYKVRKSKHKRSQRDSDMAELDTNRKNSSELSTNLSNQRLKNNESQNSLNGILNKNVQFEARKHEHEMKMQSLLSQIDAIGRKTLLRKIAKRWEARLHKLRKSRENKQDGIAESETASTARKSYLKVGKKMESSNKADDAANVARQFEATAPDINDPVLNKSVSDGIHTYKDQKTPQWKLFQRILASKRRKPVGLQLMNMFEANPNPKLRAIQSLLKDVIMGPTMMDILVDRNEILNTVNKHYMWKNLSNVYNDLKSVGVAEQDIFNTLKEQYLRYIDDIVAEAIEKGAKVVTYSETSSIAEIQSMGGSSDSFENYLNSAIPDEDLGIKKNVPGIKEHRSKNSNQQAAVAHSAISLEIMGYKEISQVNRRYSATNLKNIHDAHARYFNCLDKSPRDLRLNPCNLQEAAIARELRRNRKSNMSQKERKQKRKQQKNFDSCRLYYEPTKTCRERSIEDDEEREKKEMECTCEPEGSVSKCARCGVALSPLALTPKSSSSVLSLSSIAACGKNERLLQLTSNICEQCGFVHNQHSRCPMLTVSANSKTLRQLRLIKEISRCRCPDAFVQKSLQRVASRRQWMCA